jgi:hypothetical protein
MQGQSCEIVLGMATLIVLSVILLTAVLAPWLGQDSRDLRDHPWELHRTGRR